MATYAAVVSFNRRISMVIEYADVLLPPLTLETLQFARKKLKSFQIFVERLDSRSRRRMHASLGRIVEALRKYGEEFGQINLRSDAESENICRGIHSLVENLKKVEEEYYSLPEDEGETGSSLRVVSKSKMVGLCDQRRQLKEYVVEPWDHIAYSIVGMAGLGKTLLAREIFEDLDVAELFDCRAWVTAGIEWKSKEITESILAQVDPEAHKMIMGGHEEESAKILKECLRGRRYLIVLDDVWNEDVDEYFRSSFPNNKNGSLVLVTTRIKYVGLGFYMFCYPFDVRLLDKEESWDLLREKVFAGGSCSRHLETVGKKIAEKCDGLPLTIVTVARLLSKVDESLWIDVAEKRRHQLFIDAYDQISEVLYPSYNNLSDELKLCFLYMGDFSTKVRDTQIQTH